MATRKSTRSLDGVQAPILEETTFNTNQFRKKSLDDIQAPILTETTGNIIQNKKVGLEDIQAPILEDTSQHQTVTNVKKSLDDVSVPTLNTTDGRQVAVKRAVTTQQTTTSQRPLQANPTPNRLEGVSAPVVESQPEDRPYISKYASADIERAKKEGLKKAHQSTPPELTEEEKRRSREARRQLMEMQNQEMAKKGGKMVILLLFLGLFATVGFHLLITMPEFKEGSGADLVEKLKGFLIYYDVLLALASFLMLPKLEGFKKFSSLVFGLNILVTITLGSFLLTQMASIGVNIVFYLLSLICSVFISFQLSGNENVGKYYSSMK